MKDTSYKKAFDFAYWVDLAKNDPAQFEAQRVAVIESYFASIGKPETVERLRRVQWRVDTARQRARSPADAAVKIYDMMWDAVGKNMDAIQELANMFTSSKTAPKTSKKPVKKASVLPFRSKANEATLV
jgi:hypothetical protein